MAYTKVDLENFVFDELSALATGANFAYTDFFNSVTFALISVVGADDASLVTDSNLLAVLNWSEFFALKKLHNYYATAVDFKLGPREEKLSQISKSIDELSKTLGISGNGPIVFTDIKWQFNNFTASGVTNQWPVNWFDVDWDSQW